MNPSELPDETLFENVLKCGSAAERAAYVDRVCAGKPELRAQLEQLLAGHDGAGDFLEAAPAERPTIRIDCAPEETPGTMIGRYKLLQKIGEGGMGIVYMAEQTEPVVRRVALKIIKLGMDTRQVVARFEAERQALAMMDHQSIAKVLDAGATETGRPFFVMELVHGVPITEYCDRNKLSARERLELFIPVCQAIQHAHQKGIIHRDIKPSNVMVTLHDGKPVPRVIDFGIAKATNQRLTEKTLFTNYAQMIGTPAYMSPEQAELSGLDIDTRSDVYSLGVLLYELLTGTTPFPANELLSKGYAEMQRMIAEQEPLKPSTRMSTMQNEERTVVAKNRSMEANALRRVLQGDIDWIVMKCLEKDRTRRYETSNGLAADLQRHQSNELIAARPPTTGYLLAKLIRRNKVAFATGAVVTGALVIGAVVAVWQAVRARQAEHRALITVEELRGTAPAFAEQARALVARSKFDEAIAKLDYAVKLRPDVADYLVTKANLLQCQLKFAEARDVYRAALRVKPDHERAKANLQLTEELLAAQSANDGKLSAKDLARLRATMQADQRSAAELLLVSQRLGYDKDLLLAYWLEQLKDLPITADRPLKERLSVEDSGRLRLDLSDTALNDLSPLADMPLGWLSLNGCRTVADLTVLRGLPLRTLQANDTSIRDLSPLTSATDLRSLHLENTPVSDLAPLGGLKLEALHLTNCKNIVDLRSLAGMPLTELRLRSTRVTSLAPLHGMPLKLLDLTLVPARDFDELAGLPLETLFLQDVAVQGLSFLEGMPLKRLAIWNAPEARDYEVLSRLKNLEVLLLPKTISSLPEVELLAIDSLQHHPSLQQITDESAGGPSLDALTAPGEKFWRKWNATRAMTQRRYADAKPLLSSVLEELRQSRGELHPSTLRATRRLAECEALLGNFSSAAKLMRANQDAEIRANGPRGLHSETEHWQALGVVLLATGDKDGYRRTCAETMARFQEPPEAGTAERMLKLWSMSHGSGLGEALARRFVAIATNGSSHYFLTSMALMECRAGRWDAAEVLLDGHITWHIPAGYRDLLRVMIYCQRGKLDDARQLLTRVRERGIASWPPLRTETAPQWWDFLFLHLLLDEVTQMMEAKATGNAAAKGASTPAVSVPLESKAQRIEP